MGKIKRISSRQVRSLIASFTIDTPWEEIEADAQSFIEFPPEQKGIIFATFIANNFQIKNAGEQKTIKAKLFNPVKFLGSGWSIWKGPADGDGLSGDEDVCPKASAIKEVELSKVIFKNCMNGDEERISVKEGIDRLNESDDFTGFGLGIFLGFWEDYQIHREFSVLERLHQDFGVWELYFPGTILRNPNGERIIIFLGRTEEGVWDYVDFCDDSSVIRKSIDAFVGCAS